MTYTQFYNQWHGLGCFSIHQVHAISPDFNRSNWHQWQKSGYIVSLRQGWYAFADYLQQPDYARYFAGKICAPSYISLHTALSFYGIIPEAVVEITSVTTQKTCRYENAFGQFSYQTIRPKLFWGFEPKMMRDGKQYMMATPEKAIIDLLYLYPQYSTPKEMQELRFDEDWMREELNKERLLDYAERISSPALTKRIKMLLTAYEI
ncbi:MAG: hypothetical protein II457_00465 [Paludibacteraceae bacterium]|nr:hypothetical protein [Paludibacteraceae bacterium]